MGIFGGILLIGSESTVSINVSSPIHARADTRHSHGCGNVRRHAHDNALYGRVHGYGCGFRDRHPRIDGVSHVEQGRE